MTCKLVVLLTCLALLLGACAPTPTATPAAPATQVPAVPAASGRISFMIFGDPEEKAAYQTAVDAFMKKYPQVQVDLVHIPSQSDYKKRLAADLVGGMPADVLIISFRNYGAFAGKAALEPLDTYLAHSTVVKTSDYYPQTLGAFNFQGKQYCIPQNISSLAVYYNKNLFDAAGVAYPKANWTWDDFLATARALNKPDQDQYGLGVSAVFIRVAPFIWQNGGDIVDDMANPTRMTIDTPEAREAIEWFVALQTKEHVVPDATSEEAQGSEDRFMAGKLGMYMDSRRVTTGFRSIKDFDWDVETLPQAKQAATILHADGFCVPSASQNKAAAWALVEFLGSIEGQTILAGTGRIVPSVKVVAESPAFLDPNARPANSQAWLDQIPGMHALPPIAQWTEIEDICNKEFERAFYGNATVEEVIQAIMERTAPVFATGRP
jgi:multiple sugar transport system substrate-binding protein